MERKPNTLNRFVRFGKLAMVNQKGYGKNTFHAPPAPRGFYAMPLRYQEWFLVGSMDTYQPKQTLNYPKHPGEDATQEELEEFYKKKNKIFRSRAHKFTVDNKVELWHHLDVPNNEVISRHNSWVKTSIRTWKKAIGKESTRLRAESGGDNGINSVRKRTGYYSKDHFEVFFDTKVI